MDAVAACPKCTDGGAVHLVEVPNPATSVFKPLPKGEPVMVTAYKCSKCGWMLEVRDVRPAGNDEATDK